MAINVHLVLNLEDKIEAFFLEYPWIVNIIMNFLFYIMLKSIDLFTSILNLSYGSSMKEG